MVVHILRSRYKSDSCGMTPLHYAAQNKQNGAKTSEHLLNKASYALINWQDHKGRTALHLGIVPNPKFRNLTWESKDQDPTQNRVRLNSNFEQKF